MDDYQRDQLLNPLLTTNVSWVSVESVLRFAPEKLCSSIHTPVLFVHDPDDPIVPFSRSQRMFDRVSGEKSLSEMTGGGHNLVVETRKEEVFTVVRDWLRIHLVPSLG